jgi:hypothetical protein
MALPLLRVPPEHGGDVGDVYELVWVFPVVVLDHVSGEIVAESLDAVSYSRIVPPNLTLAELISQLDALNIGERSDEVGKDAPFFGK